MDLIWDILLDAWMDSVKMLPFLFIAYWVIEYVEHRHSERIERVLASGGRFGFVPAALLGCFPQCGFSAMAANLYGSKVITLGTLLAVFLTTSDEAIPLMLANPDQWEAMLAVIGVKIVVALLAALCIDFLLKKWIPSSVRGGYTGSSQEVDCHEHQEEDGILVATLKHTFNIFVFIFAFNIVLGGLVSIIGQDIIASVLAASGFWQPVLAGLIGLIPNCVASVLLTQLFAAGQLSFGGVVAGLCTSAGVGLAVLCRSNKSWKQNLFIILLLYVIGTAAGIVCQILV